MKVKVIPCGDFYPNMIDDVVEVDYVGHGNETIAMIVHEVGITYYPLSQIHRVDVILEDDEIVP